VPGGAGTPSRRGDGRQVFPGAPTGRAAARGGTGLIRRSGPAPPLDGAEVAAAGSVGGGTSAVSLWLTEV